MEFSDRKLVKQLLAGDRQALDEFFKSYFQRLYRFAMVRLNQDSAAAEDVVQQTLCKALDKLSTFRGSAPLFSWLCTFCRHEISAHFRKNKRAVAEVALVEDTPEIRAALDSLATMRTDDPASALDRSELTRLIQVTLDSLPSRYGDVLEWKYVEGLSVKTIAERLNVSPKAAESMMTRARAAFRDVFGAMTGKDQELPSSAIPVSAGPGH